MSATPSATGKGVDSTSKSTKKKEKAKVGGSSDATLPSIKENEENSHDVDDGAPMANMNEFVKTMFEFMEETRLHRFQDRDKMEAILSKMQDWEDEEYQRNPSNSYDQELSDEEHKKAKVKELKKKEKKKKRRETSLGENEDQSLNYSSEPTSTPDPSSRYAHLSMAQSVQASQQKMHWKQLLRKTEDSPDGSDSSDSSSESEDSQDSSGSDIPPKKNRTPDKTPPRRGYMFKSLDATEAIAAQTVVQVTRVEKECPVKINDFSLSKVCRAMKKIIEFQETENTKVKMTKVLSPACKQHLRVKYSVASEDLINMSMSDLFAIIAKETKVHSKPQFYTELKDALAHLQLMEWEKVSAENHETYYFQQLNLAENFLLVFKLILTENKHFCPALNDKENGLIKLFKSFHSYSYWKYTWATLNQRPKTMKDFIDEYLDAAMQQYQLSQAVKALPYTSSKSAKPDKEEEYHQKKRTIFKSFNQKGHSSRDKGYTPKYLSHIDAEPHSESDSDRETWVNSAGAAEHPRHSQEEDDQGDDEDSLSEASNESREELAEHEETLQVSLAAFATQDRPKADKKDYPCLLKINTGKCEREGCPYGHNREVLLKGAADLMAKSKAYIDAHSGHGNGKSGNQPPYKVLQREKYGSK